MNEALQQLIDFIKNASPVIWESTMKQVYITAAQYGVWAIVFAIAAYVCYRLYLYGTEEYRKNKWSDWDVARWFAVLGAVLFIALTILLTNGVIGRLLNAEFYAIRYLIDSIN